MRNAFPTVPYAGFISLSHSPMSHSVFLFTAILLLTVSCSAGVPSGIHLSGPYISETGPLTALNKSARTGQIRGEKGSFYTYYQFSGEQLRVITGTASRHSLSLEAALAVGKPEAGSDGQTAPQAAFGFLYENDFTDEGKLKNELAQRNTVRGVLKARQGTELKIAMAINGNQIPQGFFIYANTPVSLKQVSLIPAMLGWDMSGTTPAFYFGTGGGVVPENGITVFNFSQGKDFFKETEFPLIHIEMAPAAYVGTQESQEKVTFNIGGESISVRRTPGVNSVSLPCAAFENPFSAMEPRQNQDMIWAVVMRAAEYETAPVEYGGRLHTFAPIPADPGLILEWNQERWRSKEYELFSWDRFPNVLFFDIADYRIQDLFLKRLAFFTEKQGYRGTLVSDAEMADKHGFNAHDYRAETLAAFYSLAAQANFPLNNYELLLRQILLYNGIIREHTEPDGLAAFEPGEGAIISISREIPDYLRSTLAAHELLHGMYFSDRQFRDTVAQVYARTDPDSIRFLETYFITQPTLRYDPQDSYLMENEFMAYMLQRPISQIRSYFAGNIASWASVNKEMPELAAYIRNTRAEGFYTAAQTLSSYIFNRWGFAAGRMWLVQR